MGETDWNREDPKGRSEGARERQGSRRGQVVWSQRAEATLATQPPSPQSRLDSESVARTAAPRFKPRQAKQARHGTSHDMVIEVAIDSTDRPGHGENSSPGTARIKTLTAATPLMIAEDHGQAGHLLDAPGALVRTPTKHEYHANAATKVGGGRRFVPRSGGRRMHFAAGSCRWVTR